jgi:hypothetical protein
LFPLLVFPLVSNLIILVFLQCCYVVGLHFLMACSDSSANFLNLEKARRFIVGGVLCHVDVQRDLCSAS